MTDELKGIERWGIFPNPDALEEYYSEIEKNIDSLKKLKENGLLDEFLQEIIQGMISTLQLLMEDSECRWEKDSLYQNVINEKSNREIETAIEALDLISNNKRTQQERKSFVKKHNINHADADGIAIAALKSIRGNNDGK